MTCQSTLSLLDDYVDGELPAFLAEQVSNHLKVCRACWTEYEQTQRLKELLKQRQAPDPGPDYWSEASQLIVARAVEGPSAGRFDAADDIAERRNSFFRALVSLAASLMILFTALLIGQEHQEVKQQAGITSGPVLVASSVGRGSDEASRVVSSDEMARVAKGMLLLGPPGMLGRFAGLTELRILTLGEYWEP